ncbi:MAG: hypothetical protein V4596_02175 [Bdellovibrionota bacterium]
MKILILLLSLISASAFASEKRAYYSVPVHPELEEYAIFEIENPKIVIEGTSVILTYKMPAELVGAEFPNVVLSGEYGSESFDLIGKNARAECKVISEQTACRMEFTSLEINKKEVSKAIQKSAESFKEIRGREKVAKIFKGDPVGILSY